MSPLYFLYADENVRLRSGLRAGYLYSPLVEIKETDLQKRIFSLVLALVLTCMGLAAYAADYAPGEVLVRLKPGMDIVAFNQTFTTTTLSASPYSNSFRLAAAVGVDIPTLVSNMTADSRVASAGTNLSNHALDTAVSDQFIFTANADETQASQFIFTANDYVYSSDQFIFTANQFIFTANRNPGLFAYMSQSTSSLIHFGATSKRHDGTGVLVAVLDTGISTRNYLLSQHVTNGWNFVDGTSNTDDSPSGIDSNGNGIPDEVSGHGTMVAGLINRYAQFATLLPVKVLDSDGSGSLWATTEGIRYAISRGAKVINMSFGSPQDSPLLNDAIQDAWSAGIVIVTAAGNNNSYSRQYPAGNLLTISVGSLDANDVKASFSNYGTWMDVVAPGVGLPSTFWNGNYASWSGTSFSAPLVSAEAALIFSAQPTWLAGRVRQRIRQKVDSVDNLNLPYTGLLGKGIINMDAALSGL